MGQTATSRSLFNYLVGEYEQVMRNSEAERLGGLEIDRKLVFGGPPRLEDRRAWRL